MSAPVVVIRKKPAAPPAPYVPAIGSRLKLLLYTVFAGFAFLGATGIYLLVISVMNQVNTDQLYTTAFTFWMLIAHVAVGLIGLVPFIAFGLAHWWGARKRENRVAVRLGVVLFALGLVVGLSGVALIQIEGLPQLPTGSAARWTVYLAHVVVPIVAILAYIAHRRAGPRIQWKYGRYWAVTVALVVGGMAVAHVVDPRKFGREGSPEGVRYFFPSEARTADGKFIPEHALMMDTYCMRCHQDVYNDHLHSAHKFSSFNNPAYLFSIKETRRVALERDGRMNASRWCAGCHDPVPFFSGKFDDPNYDLENDPTAHAGITCVVCHSITHIHAPIGNAAYTIEEAPHYPFAFSDSSVLQWINNQLIKAKPELHKKTFLKPFHRTAEFCSTCHKVHLPVELNHYKDFLRGQNHYDSFVLSAVGHGARSFYFPPAGRRESCASCHMPLVPSNDFGSKDFDGSGVRKRHNHFFPAANTGLFELLKHEPRYADRAEQLQQSIDRNAEFLRDNKLRIDLFALKTFDAAGRPDDASLTVLRPTLPRLEAGRSYLVEVVVRTLNVGHHFTQGTVDSNEVWVEFRATAGGRVIGHNGAMSGPDDSGEVDPWSHFINVHMLDRNGNRVDRRNPQDIFTPLYDKQVPPGAGQVVHYRLNVPSDVTGPVELRVRLRYRKFDYKYMEYVHRDLGRPIPKLPVIDLCEDRVVLPVAGVAEQVPPQESPIQPAWQRWNDYGIGCLLEGGPLNPKKGNLKQAEAAFRQLLNLGVKEAEWHGHVNLARVLIEQGGARALDEAARHLNAARSCDPPAPWWLLAWFNGLVTAQNAGSKHDLDTAIRLFETIVDPLNQPRHEDGRPKFDFTRDTIVLVELGRTLYKRSTLEPEGSDAERSFLLRAVRAYERALGVDPEDLDSHFGLNQCYEQLARGVEPVPAPAEPVGPEMLWLLADAVLKPGAADRRRADAARLAAAITAWGTRPPDPTRPRLPTLRDLITRFRTAFHEEPDAGVQAAMAAVLASLHLTSHTLYKPDELARARTTAEYRAKNPAANAAAEAIVIYPTDRVLRREP